MGSFLFTGPTGVGKTEVARQLAKALGVQLLRFDMSEYAESHTISRLIGSPPGYVGHGEGGLLTEQVTKHPYSVVLLDEMEKAHPSLFNLMLQVMDHGKLTDASGREADFRNAVLIMTSNVGAREMERSAIGFGADRTGDDGRSHQEGLYAGISQSTRRGGALCAALGRFHRIRGGQVPGRADGSAQGQEGSSRSTPKASAPGWPNTGMIPTWAPVLCDA